MMIQPLSSNLPVSQTLATLVQQGRALRGWSVSQLAEKTRLPQAFIEQLEEGQVLFLSHYQRGLLAKALGLETQQLKQLEHWQHEAFSSWELPTIASLQATTGHLLFSNGKTLPLKELQRHPQGFWPCPHCGAGVQTLTSLLEDHEGFVLLKTRLTCSSCLFQANIEEPQ